MSAPAPTVEQRRRRTNRLPAQKEREQFLEALAAGWSVTHAAERAGVSRQRFYDLRDTDEAFAAAWTAAIEQGTQVLEDELNRRATEGTWDEEYGRDGELVRKVRRYNPAYLIFALKARRPEVYRDNAQVNVQATAVAAAAPIEHKNGLTVADVLRFSMSLDDGAHQAVIDGLINAAERRGELTPEYARALSEELRRAEASPPWAEHPGPLAALEPPKDVER